MEVALRQRLDGVAGIAISQSAQTADVDFAPVPHGFSAAAFRAAVGESEVEVLRFDIDACGVVVMEGGRQWLAAGTDRFLLPESAPAPGQHVCVTGRLDDASEPRPLLEIARVQPVP